MAQQASNLLSRSTQGASFLIGLQIGSRALTFIVNQILLRFLSPELLGISSQLELYAITVLTFARESLRISLGRQSGSPDALAPKTETADSEKPKPASKNVKKSGEGAGGGIAAYAYSPAIRAQEAVNMAYLAPLLSPVLSGFFGWLYLSRASNAVLSIPYIVPAVYVYGASTILELLSEPCFAIAAQQVLLSTRARAETIATVARCIVACGIAAWGAQTGRDLGAVPFAAGQICYAIGLNAVYWASILPRSWKEGYSLYPKSPAPSNSPKSGSRYLFSVLAKPVLFLALTLYGQSILKHFLTQGDSFLISVFASLTSQGIYALASNYGSLLARMLFQPIEESSRGVFGSLLGASTTSSTTTWKPLKANLDAARNYLSNVLRLYSLLSLGIVSLGPVVAPLLLRLVAGKAWADSPASAVLSAYCYYLPTLAFNGILEAFVAATATPAQLRRQSAWMMSFSLIFAAAGFAALRLLNMGAAGLVVANGINMAIRIAWSARFVAAYFADNAAPLAIRRDVAPRAEVLGIGLATASALHFLKSGFTGGFMDIVQSGAVAGVFGLTLVYLERQFLIDCYKLLRPSRQQAHRPVDEKKDT